MNSGSSSNKTYIFRLSSNWRLPLWTRSYGKAPSLDQGDLPDYNETIFLSGVP
ncbi:hypothetical protein NPIL_542011, partial [Nephila pilipes]